MSDWHAKPLLVLARGALLGRSVALDAVRAHFCLVLDTDAAALWPKERSNTLSASDLAGADATGNLSGFT